MRVCFDELMRCSRSSVSTSVAHRNNKHSCVPRGPSCRRQHMRSEYLSAMCNKTQTPALVLKCSIREASNVAVLLHVRFVNRGQQRSPWLRRTFFACPYFSPATHCSKPAAPVPWLRHQKKKRRLTMTRISHRLAKLPRTKNAFQENVAHSASSLRRGSFRSCPCHSSPPRLDPSIHRESAVCG